MPSTNSSVVPPESTTLILSRDINLPASAQMDQMELDLQRLREESERLSASIKQLEAQDLDGAPLWGLSNDSWFVGVEALGFALLLVVSWLAWRMLVARKHMRPQDFVNSALYPSPQPAELRSSVWFEESQQENSVLADEAATTQGRQGFDFEAAASEVERVRKSLAEKRAQREQLRHAPPPASVDSDLILASNASVVDEAVQDVALSTPAQVEVPLQAPVVLDSDLEFEFDLAPDITPPPPEPSQADTHTIQAEPVALAVPAQELEPEFVAVSEEAVVEAVADEDPVDDAQVNDAPVHNAVAEAEVIDALLVKLDLAQELYALGLNAQALELANEVIDAGRPDMTQAARELVSRCDVQALEFERQQQEYAGLLDSLREVGVGRSAA